MAQARKHDTRRPENTRRRGAVSVLAMILLSLFGSLVAAMAIASKSNLRTAATHMHVIRAQGAAETGLAIASARLEESAHRFIIAYSDIDGAFGWDFWRGNLSGYGTVNVVNAPSGYFEQGMPSGIMEALVSHHSADLNILDSIGLAVPTVSNAPAGADPLVYKSTEWLITPPVPVWEPSDDATEAFQITYAPLANGIDIRVIVTGFALGYTSSTRDVNGSPNPITRTVMQDFRITKRVNHAIISPTRIMIGKNVMIEGDLGAAFDQVTETNGDPLIINSDFYGMDSVLDAKLDDLFAAIAAFDVDNDNRLRTGHPVESVNGLIDQDYDGDGTPDGGTFIDTTGDGYLDEFDVFLNHYDTDVVDGRVNIATEFIDGAGQPVDADLAYLIDSAKADRNGNGVWGFTDPNNNGVFDPGLGETFLDIDTFYGTAADNALGYLDGYIDRLDQYAKVSGRLTFRVNQSAWISGQGDYSPRLLGPIVPTDGSAPMTFDATTDDLPSFDVSSFNDTEIDLQVAVDGATFDKQVADFLGISISDLATYIETKPDGSVDGSGKLAPRFLRLDPDVDGDGLPDNWADPSTHFEKMPFNSPNFSDWYYRPVYQNFEFKDVEIPMGNNALFVNCTFAGVTWVRTYADNTHAHWTTFGKLEMKNGDVRPTPAFQRMVYGDDAGEVQSEVYNPALPGYDPAAGVYLLRAISPLDRADVLNSEIPTYAPADYAQLPEPLMIVANGATQRVVDTRQWSNNIRFHDCLFVGSIVSDAPTEYTHVRNKLQFTGATRFVDQHPDSPTDPLLNPDASDLAAIERSSMMLPNYSVDIGQFNSPPEQNVQLHGVIIAGVLDVRGNTSINGALLLTFNPQMGSGPLQDHLGNPIGNPSLFNTTIGYFGPNEGDEESLNPVDLPVVGGVRIVGWDVDGDGIADVGPFDAPPAGSTAVPFNGYGRVNITFDKDMVLPNGILIPMQIDPIAVTYTEGKL